VHKAGQRRFVNRLRKLPDWATLSRGLPLMNDHTRAARGLKQPVRRFAPAKKPS
jgi:hypothetical protein